MKFHVVRSEPGYVKLSDGSTIISRVMITNIREQAFKPTGPDFLVSYRVSFSVDAPDSLRDVVKTKPLPPPDASHISKLDIWEIVNITESKKSLEECLCKASDNREYIISAEIEATIIARTLEYKDEFGNPIYFVRWSPKVTIRLKEIP